MTITAASMTSGTGHDEALRAVEDRVLWLATGIVDHANPVHPNPTGLKVGGHQASSASMVTIMTSLWLEQLTAEDRVSVKPHAAPVLHALEYLLGQLDANYLTTLRESGGLQSYPSRIEDRVPADYPPAASASARRHRSGARSPPGTSTPPGSSLTCPTPAWRQRSATSAATTWPRCGRLSGRSTTPGQR
jgi:hypothetical protein